MASSSALFVRSALQAAYQRPARSWLLPGVALAAALVPRWITITAVLALLLYFVLQEVHLQASTQEVGPEKRLLELTLETSCRKTAVAAALSSWIYFSGARSVRIKVYSDHRRAAYYDYDSGDMTTAPKGIIPGGWCVPVIKELSKKGRDGVSHPCLLVRYLSVPVYIWKMHAEDVGRFALLMEAVDCFDSLDLRRRVKTIEANSQVTVLGDARSTSGAGLLLLSVAGQRVYVPNTSSIYALDQCVEIKTGGANFFRSKDFGRSDGVVPEGSQLPQLGSGSGRGKDGALYPYVEVLYQGSPAFVWQWRTKEPAFREREVKQALGKRLAQEVEVADVQFPRPSPLSPSAAVVVLKMPRAEEPGTRETTILVVWQGTEFDKRPMDLFTDLAAAPVRSQMWHAALPGVWAHSGIYAKVQSDVLQHEEPLKGKIKEALKSGCCRVIFTGHSLGGGAALVAHLCFLARWQDWLQEERRLSLASIAFAAPMAFFLADDKAESSSPLLRAFQTSSQNYVFDRDVVPRLPGNPDYYRQAIRTAITTATAVSAEKKARLKSDGRLVQSVLGLLEKAFEVFASDDGMQQTYDQLRSYRHLSQKRFFHCCPTSGQVTAASFDDAAAPDMEPSSTGTQVSLMYLLACHKFFPSRIVYKAA